MNLALRPPTPGLAHPLPTRRNGRNRSHTLDRHSSLRLHAWLALATLTLIGSSAHAQTRNWTGGTNTTWSTAGNWTGGVPNTTTEVALFDATTGNDPATFSTAITLGGFSLTAGESRTLTFNNTIALDQYGVDNSAAGLNLTIAAGTTGATTLTAAQTWSITNTGNITFNKAVANGGFLLTLEDTSSGVGAINGIISGTGGITKIGSGTGAWTLSGINTYTGNTLISAGTLQLGNNLALQNSVLDTSGAGTLAFSSGINTPTFGGLTSSTNLTLASNVTALTLNPGTGVTATYSGILGSATAGMTLTKTGAGTQVLSGANTFTGLTTISAGTLKLGAAGDGTNTPLGTTGGATSVTVGAALDLNGYTLSTAEALTLNGTGIASGGALTNSGAAATYSGVVTLATASSIGGSGDITLSAGLAANANALTKVGTDTLTLSTASSRTGSVTISAGTLEVGADGAMGTATTSASVTSGAALDLNGVNYSTASALSLNGQFSTTVGALTNSGAAATYGGVVTLATASSIGGSGDITLSAGLATNALALTKVGTDTLTLNTASSRTGAVTISAGTIKLGAAAALGTTGATLVLNGGTLDLAIDSTVNAYNTSVNNTVTIASNKATANSAGISHILGTLSIGTGDTLNVTAGTNVGSGTANLTFGTTTLSASGAVFDAASGASLTLGAVSGAYGFTVQGAGGTTIGGVIGTTTGTLTKGGSGTLTLSGSSANTYTGLTTVNAGTVLLSKSSGNAIGGNLTIGDGTGTDTVQLTAANQIINTAAVTINSSGLLDLNTFSDTVGSLTINGGGVTTDGGSLMIGTLAMTAGSVATGNGTLTLGGNVTGNADVMSATISGKLALGATRTFTIADGANTTDMNIAAVISGSTYGLIKSGAGTLTLSNANTYSGVTTINGGTLSVATIGDGGVAGNLGAAAVAAGNLVIGNGTLQYTGATASTTRAFTITAGQTATFDITTNNLTISGVSAATTGGLTKIGAGTLTLSGANPYSGNTLISGGTLQLGNNLALQNSVLDTSGAGTLAFSSGINTPTFGGLTSATDLTLASNVTALTLNPGTGVTATYSGVLGSATAGMTLTKTGAGTQVLSGANTFTGTLTIAAGTLSVGTINDSGVAGPLGQSTGDVEFSGGTLLYTGGTASSTKRFGTHTGNGTIEISSGTTLTLTGVVEQLDSNSYLTKTGLGTLFLSGGGNNEGLGIVANAGTVVLDKANSQGPHAIGGHGLIINNTATVKLAGSGGDQIYEYGGVTVNSGGFLDFNARNEQFTAGYISGGGTILNNGGSGTASTMTVGKSGSGGDTSYSGTIIDNNNSTTGTMALVKDGTGTLTLSGANTYTGSTTLNGGTLTVSGAAGTIKGSTAIIINGGNLTMRNTSTAEGGVDRVGSTAPITSYGGTITYNNTSATNTYTETLGVLTMVKSQLNVLSPNAATGAGSETLTFGTGSLTHAASNTSAIAFGGTSLGASNLNRILVTSQGTTAIGQVIGPWATWGTSATAQTDYASYNRTAGGTNLFGIQNAAIAASGQTAWTTAGNAYTMNAVQTLTATRTITAVRNSGGALTLGLGAANYSLETYGVLNGGTELLTISTTGTGALRTPTGGGNLFLTTGNNDITVSAPITNNGGAVSLVKSGTGGTGTLTLTGTNTYTGSTTINAGTLALSTTGTLSDSSAVDVAGIGAIFSISGITAAGETVESLAGVAGSSVVLGAKNLTTSGDSSTTFAGVISGTNGSLTKTGSGALTLSGANTYTGTTTVSSGTLVINGNQSAATGNVSVSGTLAGTGTIGGATTIGGTHAPGAVGTVGTQNFSSALTYSAGSIFEWDLNESTNSYDQVSVTGALSGIGAVFNLVLSNGFTDSFWSTAHQWNVFSGTPGSDLATIFSTFSGSGVGSDGTVKGLGYPGTFSFLDFSNNNTPSKTTLYWNQQGAYGVVPEPSTALAGLLLAAGLLRRRRR